MKKVETVVLTKKKVESILSSTELSKSNKMKELFEGGYSVKQISELMNVRYNFVYNVVSNYVNMNSIQVEKKEQEVSKKDLIIKLYLEKKSNKEISIELKTNYNYVFNTIKKYKEENNIQDVK